MEDDNLPTKSPIEESIRQEIAKSFQSKKKRIFSKFTMAALGSIPWVGGFLSALLSIKDEESQLKSSELQTQWLEEHSGKMNKLAINLAEILQRLESFGEEIDQRLESEEYLALVRRGFRSWDQSETEEKKEFIKKLLMNAAATKLCPDDLIRLFIDWIDRYHESHFAVIREIYRNPGCSRYDIWANIHGDFPREDSAEADLYRMLIHDLSTGRVIRQVRKTDMSGRFLKKQTTRSSSGASRYMKSAFDRQEPYELSELGSQFVHYTMEDVVTRIDEQP
jgi:hypothetical protein